jgi:hypothetical protein
VEIVGHATEENKGKPERGYSAEITTKLERQMSFLPSLFFEGETSSFCSFFFADAL